MRKTFLVFNRQLGMAEPRAHLPATPA